MSETVSPAGAPPAMNHRQVLEALSGLILGMFVSMLASTVVSSSLPVIIHDLDGDQAAFTWVITATLLTTAISTPIWGKLADLFNRKFLYQLAIVVFVLATAGAGFSQNPEMLITFRAVQGIGAGGLAALSQVIMADILSPRERGKYMGLFGAVMAVATVGGPLLGGVLTDAWSWRWNFYVALPVAIIALILVQKTLRLSPHARRKVSIDYTGIVLLSAAVSLLLIWVSIAGTATGFPWNSWQSYLMVGGAALATVVFIIVELRSKEPLVPLSMFRNRTFTLAVVASISTGIAMFGASVFLSQYMQLARGATPTQAGLMTIPMIGGLLVASVLIGWLVSKYGHWKPYLILGGALLIAGSYLLSTIHYDTDFVLVSLFMFLLGAGVGMTMQNLVLIVQNTCKPSEIGVASSGVTFFRSLGGTVGVAVMGAALAAKVTDLMKEHMPDLVKAIMSLGDKAPYWQAQLASGALPKVSDMPHALSTIIEDIYAQGISHSFLIGVPFAVVSLLAILFLPNVSLTRMTNDERLHAGEADLATVSVEEGMSVLTATGSIGVVDEVDAAAATSGPAGDAPGSSGR
ncbi:MDR family MFS transporter [Microbacterium terrisoli]|uniref:MDR family MFS transporter n=1 Tax=Microbacterium terrisoli TaxID=3242192 RepID=UPI00280574A3|nr:MDR family MFS transporter [Microbacterium protaetiae]